MLSFRNQALALLAIVSTVLRLRSGARHRPTTIQPPSDPLQINVRNVLVDVVVTDKKGVAVPGLHKEDFEVLENGKPPDHRVLRAAFPVRIRSRHNRAPPLPPNTFTNVPAAEPNQAINILLMDALNTTTPGPGLRPPAHRQIPRYHPARPSHRRLSPRRSPPHHPGIHRRFNPPARVRRTPRRQTDRGCHGSNPQRTRHPIHVPQQSLHDDRRPRWPGCQRRCSARPDDR